PIRFGLIASSRQLHFSLGHGTEVRCVEIIFSGNTDEREQRIAPGIGEGRSHSLRRGHIGDRTHRPFRGNPFARRMRKHSRETKKPGIFVDSGGLDCRDLMPAKALADNVQTARQGGVAEGAVPFTMKGGIGLSQQAISRDWSVPLELWPAPPRWCQSIHWSGAWLPSMLKTSKLTAPDLDRLARMPWPIASLASSGIRALSSVLAFSCSR